MKTPTTLIAEDDPADSSLLQWALNQADVKASVNFVRDGIEVLEYLQDRNRPVQLLVLDLKMPRMGGFEVLEWLRSHPEFRPARVVILSGSFSGQDIRRAGAFGVDHYMVKPTNSAELVGMAKRIEQYCPTLEETAIAASARQPHVAFAQSATQAAA